MSFSDFVNNIDWWSSGVDWPIPQGTLLPKEFGDDKATIIAALSDLYYGSAAAQELFDAIGNSRIFSSKKSSRSRTKAANSVRRRDVITGSVVSSWTF